MSVATAYVAVCRYVSHGIRFWCTVRYIAGIKLASFVEVHVHPATQCILRMIPLHQLGWQEVGSVLVQPS